MSVEELRSVVNDATRPDPSPEPAQPDGPPDWRAEVSRLAALSPIEADREIRACAEALGCQVTTLREEVRRARGEQAGAAARGAGRALELPEPEPCPEPVHGAGLLDEIAGTFRRFLALPEHADTALALWVEHAHAFRASPVTPRLGINSPQKRCGKTTCLEIVTALTPRPLLASSITAAAIFRTVELVRPTLAIDEADTFLAASDELRGVLNSGHRRSGEVIRTVEVGGEHEPRRFSTWCPVAVALIGRLPGTLEDRAVAVQMRRRAAGEVVERWRGDRADLLLPLARRCARWAADYEGALGEADPEIPAGLHDRAADNWRPLLAIADAAGGDWPERARRAALALSGGAEDSDLRAALLADIRDAFREKGDPEWLASSVLLAALHGLGHRPWPAMPRTGKPITEHKLGRMLGEFGIDSSRNAAGTARGYKRAAFRDAWARYLPVEASKRQESSNGAGSAGSESVRRASGADALGSSESSATVRVSDALTLREDGDSRAQGGTLRDRPAWTEIDAWHALERAAEGDPERLRKVAVAWAAAAGGVASGTAIVLPRLPFCMALAELKALAQGTGLEVRERSQ